MVPLEAVSRAHRVIALVKPSRSQSWLRRTARSILWRTGMGTSAAMARWARIHDVPLLEATAGSDSELANELERLRPDVIDRKSTRLNSSHPSISYAVFCLKKKKKSAAGLGHDDARIIGVAAPFLSRVCVAS